MNNPAIAIILCAYNGERFLKPQLASFARQSFLNWALFVYDDGSTDTTSAIVHAFQQENMNNPVYWLPNAVKQGFAQNFLQGICRASGEFDYYALSDQDDVWCDDKLSRAVTFLSNIPAGIPAVYGGRTTLIDADGNPIGLSRLFDKPPSFRNALMQSIAGGNTMVLNKAARTLLLNADKNADIVSHDWFIYQLVTGAGGVFYYDPQPSLLYRQHGNNIIGSNLGFFARLYRATNLFNGTFKSWNDKNIDALQKNAILLTPENRDVLALLVQCREQSFMHRLLSFSKLGIYRQQWLDNVALFFAWAFRRI